ncbi:hypothetical protein J3U16_11940 [Gilliamella sp. B3023]|uniref:hypothetical protein n=1 Tax=unclassified Gilliamella TaxID=2685620 RepID=UPI002269B9F3|nr:MULTISPECIES: hypothetical protein [unclassified Gilliamella]MCX8586753.1 hypothetical protein [Gilliamella sp. B3562]MCX8675999.1 hypothetical protein [Gilliamella sp. B3023]MCX8686345.1 hypothetical protein [Gilliamella sp. B2864]
MRDQKERVETIESTMKNEFEYALEVNLITQEQHDNYLHELNELTSYIYEKYKDSLAFYDEDWIIINNYYEKIVALDFVRTRTKNNLELIWLIEM